MPHFINDLRLPLFQFRRIVQCVFCLDIVIHGSLVSCTSRLQSTFDLGGFFCWNLEFWGVLGIQALNAVFEGKIFTYLF